MPTHERRGTDNRENRQDRWKPAIQLDEEPTIVVREPDAATKRAPQNNQLMSERGILSLKPDLRLEQRGQHGQDKPDEPDHRGNLAESSLNKPELGFRYTHPLRQNIRPFAGFRLQIPVSLDRRQDLGSFYARCRTPFAVHDVRRLSACLGAQHSCRGGTTLFDHVSHDEWT